LELRRELNPSIARDIFSLSKPLVTIGVTFTAFAGYIINANSLDPITLTFLSIGVMLMSAAAATLNHIVEKDFDALMQRTKHRPIASGRLSAAQGLIVALVFFVSGFIVLYINTTVLCVLLGIFNVLWYILVYTPLKRVSVWAVFVGSLTGVIPYFMGVLAAVPSQISHINLFVGIFLMMWQIPHFILLTYRYGNEYHNAGLASIITKFSQSSVIKIYFIWMIVCSLIILLLPALGYINPGFAQWSITLIGILYISFSIYRLMSNNVVVNYSLLFFTTNIMQVLFLVILMLDKL
jgi:heme o synthase